jgi:oxysterol-binding protein 1
MVEYNDLLEKAALETDSMRRMAYVATYSIARYAHMAERGTKPFNPLLGETYELVT